MSWLKRVGAVGAIAAAIAAGACSESTAPSAVDATASATAVASLSASLGQIGVLQSLAALSSVSALAAPVARVVLGAPATRGEPWSVSLARTRAAMRLLAARAPAATEALFPANVLGKVFQWDPDSLKYRITDSTKTGAPSNGVRFILYQVDTATGEPSSPLTTTGTLDLTDASTPQANVLQVLLKAGSQTAANYSISEVKTTSSLTLTAAGSVSDVLTGGTPVNFNLQHVLDLSDSSLATNYQASSAGTSVALLDTLSGSGGTPSFGLNWSVTRGGTIAVVGHGDADAINLNFNFNGTTMATASGPADNPSISLASGKALTAGDLLALATIFTGLAEVEYNLSLLFAPGVLVFG